MSFSGEESLADVFSLVFAPVVVPVALGGSDFGALLLARVVWLSGAPVGKGDAGAVRVPIPDAGRAQFSQRNPEIVLKTLT